MEQPVHTMNLLFDQLGLDSSEKAINEFIDQHRPLARDIKLHEADFINDSQAIFLLDMKEKDADWAAVVDQLDARLR